MRKRHMMVLWLHRKRHNGNRYAFFITTLKESMKKIIVKSSKIKEKICETCGLQDTCGDLPGFCALIYYIPIALVIVGLAYLLITMNL